MFPLVRYFSIASLVAFVAAFVLIFFSLRANAVEDLITLREQNNIELTLAYANSLLEDHGDFIRSAGDMSVEEIMASEDFAMLDNDIRQLTEGSTIIKVKIYALNGLTIYSSEVEQIGESKLDNPGFLAGLGGGVASELVYKDTFNAFEGNIEDRDIVESYVPLKTASSDELSGVIELYDDVSTLLARIDERQVNIGLGLGALFAVLYVGLFFIVRYAESIMRDQRLQIERNVQELATANASLKEANVRIEEANRLKSEFLSTMSHELRTPLNAIIGYSSIITSGIAGSVDERATTMVQRIHDSGQHLLTLINNVLDISKIEAGRMTIVLDETNIYFLRDEVQEQLQVLADRKDLAFINNIDEKTPRHLMLDGERVKQIMINLISNAVKFTDEGSVTLDLAWQSDTLTMQVKDTGVGIPAHMLDTIFDEFRQVDGSSTRRIGGTGLGLAIVKKFTEAMGGTVSVQSAVGVGTTFTVKIPAAVVESQLEQAV